MEGKVRNQLLQFDADYAIIIGIANYASAVGPLTTPLDDADGLARVLKEKQGYQDQNVFVLQEEVGKERLTTEIRQIKEKILQDTQNGEGRASLLFYYAGHGLPGRSDGLGPAGYFLPEDTKPEALRLQDDSSLLPMDWVLEEIQAMKCHHNLVILDCCFAGAFRRIGAQRRSGGLVFRPLTQRRFDRYKERQTFHVLVSAGPAEEAADFIASGQRDLLASRSDFTDKDHSPFAKALIDGLAGGTPVKPKREKHGDGVITSHELFLYLYQQVESVTTSSTQVDTQHPDLFPLGEGHDGGQFIFIDPSHARNDPDWAELKLVNPYKGLEQYDITDAPYYFGRQEDLALIKKGMKLGLPMQASDTIKPKVLIIAGASGSGKSSLAKAAIIPWYLNEGYEVFQLQPGQKPWQLSRFNEAWNTVEEMSVPLSILQQESSPTLLQSGSPLDIEKKQILLVDQYEDLYTSASSVERFAFETALIQLFNLSRSADSPFRLILTIRSDFELELQQSNLGRTLNQHRQQEVVLHRLIELGLEDLRMALTGPADLLAFDYEEALIDQIIDDLNFVPGALPLLSYTMRLMVEETDKDERKLRQETYNKDIKGVAGAFQQKADQVLEAKPSEVEKSQFQALFKKIFLRLVQLNDGNFSRRSVLQHTELDYPQIGAGEQVEDLLTALQAHFLISRGGNKTKVSLLHDSLINSWATGRQWINDFSKEKLLLQRQLWEAAVEWAGLFHREKQESETTEEEHLDSIVLDPSAGDTSPEQEKPISASQARLWHNNPKLQEVMYEILDPKGQLLKPSAANLLEGAYHIWNKDIHGKNRERVNEFLAWMDEQYPAAAFLQAVEENLDVVQLFDRLVQHTDHWLNRTELQFVRASWVARQDRIAELRRQLSEAETSALVARAQALPRQEMTAALRMLESGWDRLLEDKMPILPVLQRAIAGVFYQQFAGKEFSTCQPLPKSLVLGEVPEAMRSSLRPSDTPFLNFPIPEVTQREWFNVAETHKFVIKEVGNETEVELWDLEETKLATLTKQREIPAWEPLRADFAPSSELLAISWWGHIELYDQIDGQWVARPFVISDEVYAESGWPISTAFKAFEDIRDGGTRQFHFTEDEDLLITYTDFGGVAIWDLDGQRLASNLDLAIFPEVRDDYFVCRPSFSHYLGEDLILTVYDFHEPFDPPEGAAIRRERTERTISARVWDSEGTVRWILDEHPSRLEKISYSFVNDYFTAIYRSGVGRIYDREGSLIASLQAAGHRIAAAEFTEDGHAIYTRSTSSSYAYWPLKAQGSLLADVSLPESKPVGGGGFFHNAPWVLLYGKDNLLQVKDFRGDEIGVKSQELATILGQDRPVVTVQQISIETDPIRQHYCFGIAKQQEGAYMFSTGMALFLVEGDRPPVLLDDADTSYYGLDWFDDDQFVVGLAEYSRQLYYWEKIEGKWSARKDLFEAEEVKVFTWSPDGQFLFIEKEQGYFICDRHTRQEWPIPIAGVVEGVHLSANSTCLLVDKSKTSCSLWSIEGSTLLKTFALERSKITVCTFSPSGKQLLIGSEAGEVYLIDLEGNRPIKTCAFSFGEEQRAVSEVQFSPDEAYFLIAYKGFDQCALRNGNGELVAMLNQHVGKISKIDFSPVDPTMMLTLSSDGTAKLWPRPDRIYRWVKENHFLLGEVPQEEEYR